MIEHILDTISPHRCCSCHEIGQLLCGSCRQTIVSEPLEGCLFCSKPCGERGVCLQCPDLFDQVWGVGERLGELKLLGDAYKFDNARAGAAELAALLDARLPLVPSDVHIVGIPTSSQTIRRRGFDHVGLVVKQLAKLRSLPVAHVLVRESTATLHFLNKTERQKLAPHLFSVKSGAIPEKVLLVDDIVTTGTTLYSAARLLRSAGVQHLYAAVIAKQPKE